MSQPVGSSVAQHGPELAAWLAVQEAALRERLAALSDVSISDDEAAAAAIMGTPVQPEALYAFSGLKMDEVERFDAFLSGLINAALSESEAAAHEVVDKHPALVLSSLVGRASRVATTSDLWSDWAAGLGLSAPLTEHLAARTPEMLEELGLASTALLDGSSATRGSEEDSARLIMLNAGVQQSVMPLIIERIEEAAGLTSMEEPSPSDVVQALVAVKDSLDGLVAGFADDAEDDIPRALRVLAASVPVRAKELVSATHAFLIATAADPANWESRDDLGPEDTGLPPLLYGEAREELRARPVGTPKRRQAIGVVSTTGRPQLFFQEDTGIIGIQLPTPVAPTRPEWTVTYGGSVVQTPAVALEDGAGRPFVAIEEPVRDVLVELGDARHWLVPAVDTEDPVLIFGADGQSVSDKVSLHSESVHVLYPNDARLIDPATGLDVPMITDPAPSRWDLWQIAEADLRDVTAVQVIRPGAAGEVRSASPQRRARLTNPHARLQNTVTDFGTPVHDGGPVALFPRSLSGHDESWNVQVAQFTGYGEFADELVMEYELEVPAAGGEVEILTDDDYPWLGEFVVRLTNPRGRSFQAHFAVAEQAHIDLSFPGGGDGFRIPTEGGLTSADIRVVSGEKPLESEPAMLRLRAADESGVVELSTEEGSALTVQVTPGVLRFEIPLTDEDPVVRTRTMLTRPGRLDVHGEFRINAPGELRHAHLAVRSGERDICRVPLTRRGDEAFGDLGSYADRVGMLRAVTVSLDWTRVTGRKLLSIPLVEATSQDPVTSISLDDREISVGLTAVGQTHPITLYVWSAGRPWNAPVGIPVAGGTCELPEELLGAGPYVVQAVVGTPEERRPVWPTPESIVLDEGQGESLSDVSLSTPHMARLWSLLAARRAARAITLATAPGAMPAEEIRSFLTEDPRVGLQTLNSTSIRLGDQAGMLIGSGLVLGDFAVRKPTPGRRRVPWLGALSSLADLSAARATGDLEAAHEQLDYLRAIGGEALTRALATGQDATLESAKIDMSSVQIASLPKAQADLILAQVFDPHRMVPGPLTDDDARFTAIYEVVERRDDIVDAGLMLQLAKQSRALFQAVTKVSPKLRKAVNVRFHKLDGIDADDPSLHWTLVPGTSLLIAVAARGIARFNAQATDEQRIDDSVVRDLLDQWASLADLVPTLVMSDLLIADALVAFALDGDLTKDPE